jgi:hypothetical protein
MMIKSWEFTEELPAKIMAKSMDKELMALKTKIIIAT